jgi:oligopeptide transport system substrate-binding protein
MYYVGLNTDVVPALKDRRVRQAIGMALDRDKIVNDILGGVNRRADSILPPSVFGFRESTNYLKFDLAKAKALLAEAGFPEGKGFPAVQFSYRDGRPDVELVAQAVQQQLKQNLGIEFQPRKVEWGAYLKEHNSRKLPAFHMRWAADYLDAENFLSQLLASYGNENKVNYKNAEYDKLCAEADGILDEAKRKELYGKAEDIVLQDAPFIPIYFQKDAELISSRVSGMRESAFGHLPHTTTAVK